jgi:hypothetical protein
MEGAEPDGSQKLQKTSSKVLTSGSKRGNNLASALNERTARRKKQPGNWSNCEVL